MLTDARWLARAAGLGAVLVSGCYSAPLSRPVVTALAGREIDGRALPVQLAREPDPEGPDIEPTVTRLLSQPLEPSSAVELAMLTSPDVQAELETLGVSRSALLGPRRPPNPGLDIGYRPGRGSGGDELEAHLILDLVEIATRPLRRAAAEARVTAAELEAADALLSHAYAVRVATVHAQASRARYERLAAVVETARGAYETARALGESGNLPAMDVLTHRALYEELRMMRAEAELEMLERTEDLVVLIGLTGERAVLSLAPLATGLPAEEPSLEQLEPRAVERSVALASARARLEAIARDHDVARTDGILPHVHVGLAASYAEQTPAFGPALSMTLPVFDQGQGIADGVEAELHVAQQRYAATAVGVRSSVRRARNRLVMARTRHGFLATTLAPVRARLVEETLRQYNAMNSTPFAVLEARRAELENELAGIDAARDYWLARSALDQILVGGEVELGPSRGSETAGAE